MAHGDQFEFVAIISRGLRGFFTRCKVLEVGSLNVNGTIRPLFEDCDYLGLDVGPGGCVDLVCQGQDYRGADGSFDTVVSCEAMEHNPYWKETLANMTRLCRPGGLVLVTCATIGRREHGTDRTMPDASPHTVGAGWSYYRNLREVDFRRELDLDGAFERFRFWRNWTTFDLYFLGSRRGGPQPLDETEWTTTIEALDRFVESRNACRRSRYRKLAAHWFGDRWFERQRAVLRPFIYFFD